MKSLTRFFKLLSRQKADALNQLKVTLPTSALSSYKVNHLLGWHQLNAVLRESHDRFHQVAANIDQVFWVRELQTGKILYVSPAYEKIWGRSCQSLYEAPDSWMEAVHPQDRARVQVSLTSPFFATDEEYRILRPDGELRWVKSRIFPLYNAAGKLYRLTGLIEDISDRKQNELDMSNLIRREQELRSLQSRFIETASHEFRTPLTSILLSAEMLERYGAQATPEKRQHYFNQIREATRYIDGLLDDVLAVRKEEAEQLEFHPIPVDLKQICLATIQEWQKRLSSRYQLSFTSPGSTAEKIWMLGESQLLSQILNHLVSNAVKYSPGGGQIQLTVVSTEEQLQLRIQDQGIGILRTDRPRLFEPFFRGSNISTIRGTGLGLAIVKQAVELHGGQISVESEVDRGTTFTLTFPT